MKKIISILTIITIILLGTINVYAEGETITPNIEINLKGQTTITEEAKTVELTLSLGEFTEIEENIVLGYETSLEYDTNMFESVKVEGLNGWTATYEESTKALIGELSTATAKANTDITKITLTLKDGIQAGDTGTVKISNLLLSDGENDFTFNKEVTITMEETKKPEGNNNNNSSNNDMEVGKNNTLSTNGTNTDKTTAVTKLPSAGMKNIFIIAIVIIGITGMISFIRYKNIKLK